MMKTKWIIASLLAATSGFAAQSQAQMKTAVDFERELDARPLYRIVQQDGKWQIQKPQPIQKPRVISRRNGLAWSEWELQSPTFAGLAKKPVLKFTDSRIGASVGLNSIGSTFKVEGNSLKIGALMATRMAGPQPLMDAENAYSKALEAVRNWQISPDGRTLTLSGDGVSELRFGLARRTPDAWEQAETKIVRVEPTLGPEMDGDKAPKYLQLEDLSEGTSWGRFTAPRIEGFDFKPVNQYVLQVAVERNPRSEPSQRLRLVQVVSQKFLGKIVPQPGEVMVEVAPSRIESAGVAPMQSLQVRVFGDGGYGQWQPLYGEIQGFDFVEGAKYRLLVREVSIKNPPADAPSKRYKLVRLLEKMPVTQ